MKQLMSSVELFSLKILHLFPMLYNFSDVIQCDVSNEDRLWGSKKWTPEEVHLITTMKSSLKNRRTYVSRFFMNKKDSHTDRHTSTKMPNLG